MQKKTILLLSLLILALTILTACSSGDYDYYSAEKLKNDLEQNNSLIILDVQVKEDFQKHHITGAISTYAYPVKSEEDRNKINKVLPQLKDSEEKIIIVCPGGGGGATRTYDHLEAKGIAKDRLYVLEDGQSGWDYDKFTVTTN